MRRSELGTDMGDDDDDGAWGDGGSTGMKEKEVGVVSDCNIAHNLRSMLMLEAET
jgi:hypothetical protein